LTPRLLSKTPIENDAIGVGDSSCGQNGRFRGLRKNQPRKTRGHENEEDQSDNSNGTQ